MTTPKLEQRLDPLPFLTSDVLEEVWEIVGHFSRRGGVTAGCVAVQHLTAPVPAHLRLRVVRLALATLTDAGHVELRGNYFCLAI